MAQDDLNELAEASRGLLYPSETDAPFEPFCWPAQGARSARDAVAGHARKGQKIEEVAANDFFGELEDAENADGFRRLRGVLESRLGDLKVFRVGAIRIDVYLTGRAQSGEWCGLHTVSVET